MAHESPDAQVPRAGVELLNEARVTTAEGLEIEVARWFNIPRGCVLIISRDTNERPGPNTTGIGGYQVTIVVAFAKPELLAAGYQHFSELLPAHVAFEFEPVESTLSINTLEAAWRCGGMPAVDKLLGSLRDARKRMGEVCRAPGD
jgi:hypothetical protein